MSLGDQQAYYLHGEKTYRVVVFSRSPLPNLLNNRDNFMHILKSTASMYESSSSHLLRTTTVKNFPKKDQENKLFRSKLRMTKRGPLILNKLSDWNSDEKQTKSFSFFISKVNSGILNFYNEKSVSKLN